MLSLWKRVSGSMVMCGRFSQNMGRHQRAVILFRKYGQNELVLPLRYNIAPTQFVPIIIQRPDSAPVLERMYWGLVPFWAKDMRIGSMSINARAETVDTKPTFRTPFKTRRCLVPASGFYEWKQDPADKSKTPYYFTAADQDEPLVFAGLWDIWEKSGEAVYSFCIITTQANNMLKPFHNRMPAIMPSEHWEEWLDPGNSDYEGLKSLLRPADEGLLQFWKVSPYVNSARNEGEQCVESVA